MLVKIAGAFDLFVALVFIVMALKVHLTLALIIPLIIILTVKSVPFVANFCIGSIIDIFAAIVLFISMFISISSLILIIAALAIGQKGAISLF